MGNNATLSNLAATEVGSESWPIHQEMAASTTADHFVQRNGIEFAGTHLIFDFWNASHLDDLARMEKALKDSVDAAQATLLHIHLHHFTPNGGISGVAILAESHISVHTWPERNYAAFDVFMCGDAKPELTIAVLKNAFHPKRMNISELLRGVVESHV